MHEISFTPQARRFYERADAPLQRRLDRAFDVLKRTPRRHPNVKPLSGVLSGSYRYRVGDYRIVYRVEGTTLVVVLVIAHRREVYE